MRQHILKSALKILMHCMTNYNEFIKNQNILYMSMVNNGQLNIILWTKTAVNIIIQHQFEPLIIWQTNKYPSRRISPCAIFS